MDSQILRSDLAKRTEWHEDPVTGEVHIVTRQDVEDVLDRAAATRAGIDERARFGDMAHVASIPLPILFELERVGILSDDKAFRAWLNSPEHRKFRTRNGRV